MPKSHITLIVTASQELIIHFDTKRNAKKTISARTKKPLHDETPKPLPPTHEVHSVVKPSLEVESDTTQGHAEVIEADDRIVKTQHLPSEKAPVKEKPEDLISLKEPSLSRSISDILQPLEKAEKLLQPNQTVRVSLGSATVHRNISSLHEPHRRSIIVDGKFVKNVANIIQTTALVDRERQFNDLLRNINYGQDAQPEPKSPEEDNTGCCPGFLRFAAKKPKSPPPTPAWLPKISETSFKAQKTSETSFKGQKTPLPRSNQSFYNYRLKSKLEGLTFNPQKIYKYGEKGSGFQSKGAAQDFYELRDQCLSNGTLFEDPEFPPTDSSLFYSHRADRNYQWKRPSEIVDNPQLFVEGFSRFDVQQGELGDCWLLAAVANLTLYRRLFFQIVPDDQSFEENYAGIFHFRFWQYGRWIDVVIDDRLPTYRGELIFLHSTEANEFWSALLEKAYAKLHGSYEALKGGSTCEAMEDFTGGVTEMYEMNATPPNLFKIIIKAYERWSLMGCSIEPDPNVFEAQTPEGLVRGHAYSITKVQYVNIQTPNVSGKIPLLRLRNPWGNESEWNGPWSDNSPEWQFISEEDKEELGLNFDADGEFWISFKDFQQHFSRLEICNLNPDSLSEDELCEGRNKKWVMSVFEGEWVRGVTAGGCRNFLETFPHNPQYRVVLDEEDEGDEDGKCTMIVALMQKNRRQMRHKGGEELLTIGFAIYYLPYPDRAPKPLDLSFFKYNASVARSPSFINLREVSCRFKLPRGTYCIVPSTFDPNEEGEFLLRVFSEHQNNMEYDGSCTDNLRPLDPIASNEVDDEDEDRQPQRPNAPSYPSGPYHPPSPSPYSNPYPSSPPNPYPSNPYPNNPYPYPSSTPYGQYPYPQNPQQPYPPQNYPQYPQYPSDPRSSRGSRGSDPISSFFKNLFR